TCQSAFFDTISGDCQYHDCIYGQTPPDRFQSYIKATATEYCPGTSPTGSTTRATQTLTAVPTATSSSASASATGNSGALAWGSSGGMDAGLTLLGLWVAAGLLG
ncbi:hypothetical protein N657DRAFT_542214, partial [Parathielavia appendiculata]